MQDVLVCRRAQLSHEVRAASCGASEDCQSCAGAKIIHFCVETFGEGEEAVGLNEVMPPGWMMMMV